MKLKDLLLLIQKLEPWLAGLFFAYFLGIALPPQAVSIANLISYPILAFLILVSGCWKKILFAMTRDIPLLLLHVMALVSVFWSMAPEVTGDETKAFIRAGVFGVYIAVRFGLGGEMRLLAKVLGIAAVLSLIAGVAFPTYGIQTDGEFIGAWKGIFGFKNLFAAQMTSAILLLTLLGLQRSRWRWLIWSVCAIAVALLLLSRGRTALAALLITMYLFPLYSILKQDYRLRVASTAIVLAVSLGVALSIFLNLQFIVVDVLGKNLEFNGRLPIWNMVLEKGLEHFWLGHGYSGFWTSGAAYPILTQTWAVNSFRAGVRFNAHNGFLELFLQLGIVGLTLYLISLCTLFFRAFYLLLRLKTVELFWVFQSLILAACINSADSFSVASAGGEWSIFVSFAIAIALQYRRLKIDDRLGSPSSDFDQNAALSPNPYPQRS
ncbi:O-antigen ligase family protein [Leptolyngbya sp. DQ-M1]|uniref:O-antigen ligase family protein n=1 Tax=Leptolyngbya sp. DQ-M1 TaxID=2933920 RepID=UPI0032979E4F